MADTAKQLALTLLASTAISPGDVVRLTGAGTVGRADASTAIGVENVLGIAQVAVSVASGAPVPVAMNGTGRVRLETGLSPAYGDLLYASATSAGAATTIAPAANAVVIGRVLDPTGYSSSRPSVLAELGQVVDASGASNNLVADWPISSVRYFAVDYDNGNDANRGWSDTSAADAGANAVKTWDQLRLILPINGAGRIFRIFVKPRAGAATYLNKAGGTADLDLRGFYGYSSYSVVRATTDFTDSTADQILCGAKTASAGPNSDGSWTVATYATRVITVSAGSLPATATVGGKRVRFTGNVTAALTNACAMIQRVNGTPAIVISNDLPGGSPVAGDTFFIEDVACVFGQLFGSGLVSDNESGNFGLSIVGFRFTLASQQIQLFTGRIAFCEFAGFVTISAQASISLTRLYRYVLAGSIVVGGNRLEAGVFSFNGLGSLTWFHTYHGGTVTYSSPGNTPMTLGTGCYFGANVVALNIGRTGAGNATSGFGAVFGRASSTTSERAYFANGARLQIAGSSMNVYGCDVNGVTNRWLYIIGEGNDIMVDDVISSDGGNTGILIDAGDSINARVTIGRLVPVSTISNVDIFGASGMRMWLSQLRELDVWDSGGNHFIGTGRICAAPGMPYLNGEGSTMVPGTIVRVVQQGFVRSSQGNATGSTWHTIGAVANPAAPSGGPVMVVTSGPALVQFTGTPTAPAIVYLDSTPGAAIYTPPANPNQKLRLGGVLETTTGPRAIVRLAVDNISVNADGSP